MQVQSGEILIIQIRPVIGQWKGRQSKMVPEGEDEPELLWDFLDD